MIRPLRLARAAAVAAALLASPALTASAAPPPIPTAGPFAAGACAFAGTLTEHFTPAVSTSPSNVTVTITGSGTCAGSPGVGSLTINVSGTVLLSCEAGFGSLAGPLTFSGALPPIIQATGSYAGGPGTVHLVLVDLLSTTHFVAVANLAWSPTAVAACATAGTTSTPLTGALAYAYG